jgi:hypothetical protein
MKDNLNFVYWQNFRLNYKEHQKTLTPLAHFLSDFTSGYIKETGNFGGRKIKDQFLGALYAFYDSLEHNVPQFIDYLKEHKFSLDNTNTQEEKDNINTVIDKYRYFSQLLFSRPEKSQEEGYLFAVANRLFEYCFSESTWGHFKNLITTKKYHPLARFLYSNIWYHFVGEGWHNWHKSCLEALAKHAREGKEIVYIAGGDDILEPLKYGIYNITVIDPMLPTQDTYYSEGWLWLVKNDNDSDGKGDKIEGEFGGKNLTLTRTKYKESDTFPAKLSNGKTINIPESTTVWEVKDIAGQKLGKITFLRRFCEQSDFNSDPKKVLLLSFNEMYYTTLAQDAGGWGLQLDKFPNDLNIYVKQLRNSVSKKTLALLKQADNTNFRFISLGSCPT